MILQVALDTPLRRVFDYLPPADAAAADAAPVDIAPADAAPVHTPPADAAPVGAAPPGAAGHALKLGVRVSVPFGRRQLIGVLVGIVHESAILPAKLKRALALLDAEPVFDPVTFDLLMFAADYYHHPLGEVIAAALPVALRLGQAVEESTGVWTLTESGRRELEAPGASRRAPRQRALLTWLADRPHATIDEVTDVFKPDTLKTAARRGWVVACRAPPAPPPDPVPPAQQAGEVSLTDAQAKVIDAVTASSGHYSAHLLYGVTGSGKTEVYLRVIAQCIAGGGQALVLVPEIALTPQLVERFRRRFAAGVAVLHSALTGTERRAAWRAAHGGLASIVIGTRSAVFAALPRLALIVVDEEHDASYKQHEGFRYSARDLAVWRAQRARVPIILGSATPSLETLENVLQGRYTKHLLPQRPGGAQAPHMALVDLRRQAVVDGLSQPAIQAIGRHLGTGGQVIVFLNRRGYAPSLFCNACGWVAPCGHCDARMTLHRRAGQLRCHHCGAHAPVPPICGSCGQPLHPVGQGTERVEETLARLFPDAPLARLDRDTAAGRGAMEGVLDRVHRGEARILIGTQMLTKGHHFPEVSLVVILDADQGLFASDFRATERLAQTITQVAGRAGRATRPGEVLIQTEFPEHPLLTRLITEGYEGFASGALRERREAAWPPYSRLALLRAEAKDRKGLDAFLHGAAAAGQALRPPEVNILGPATALMARRADHYRAHLLIEAALRSPLQRFLARWLPQIDALPGPAGLRWSIDVDPLEVE